MRVLVIAIILVVVAGVAGAAPKEHHVRLRTVHGPIHVWTPADYDPASAATVVYVHGYFANVDDAWRAYHLASQFRASRLNAMFVACEAPVNPDDPVAWPDLSALLETVKAKLGSLPSGRLVAIGHSGAHRTISEWLDEPRLDTISLIDAAYGDLSAYRQWLMARDDRRLIDIGDLTRDATDAFHEALPETVVVERFPPPERGALPGDSQSARVLYVRSYMGHMTLVTGGVAIPMILRALVAPLVDDTERSAPLG